MNFKEWHIKEYGYTGQGELGGKTDPFGIKQHGGNLIAQGAEGIARGIGSQLAKTIEKTGAKPGALGQTNLQTGNIRKDETGTIILDIFVPAHLVTDQGGINKRAFNREGIKIAIKTMAQQHKTTPQAVQEMYAFATSPIQVHTTTIRNGIEVVYGTMKLRPAPKRERGRSAAPAAPAASTGDTLGTLGI